MTIYQWNVFLTVAEQRSFVKAAHVLNVSQSAVSHIIAKIEEEYGYTLFIRNKNNAELTSSGRIMIPYVRNLLACNNSLEQTAAELKNVSKGEVKIAAFNSAMSLWLPGILQAFHKRYPEVRVCVEQTGDLRIRKKVDAGEIDFAFLPSDMVGDHEFLPLHISPMMCLAPKGFAPLNGVSVTPEDLQTAPLILQSEGYDTEMRRYFEENNLPIQTDFRIEVDDTCFAFVEKGFGFCITAQMTADCNPRDVSVWPLEPRHDRLIGLVTVYPDFVSPAAVLFREEIVRYIKANGYYNIDENK